jgi:uncharacterized protein (TIGR04255 family)
MPFPHSEREIYPRSPLKEVICQVKYPAILEISGADPIAFQNDIRQAYPIYTLGDQALLNVPGEVAQLLKQLPMGVVRTPPVHKFSKPNGSTTIALGQDFLAVTSSQYEDWPAFKAEIELARGALQQHYKPTFYERIGLRYKDLIVREDLGMEGEAWSALLQPFVLGFLGVPEVMSEIVGVNSLTVISLAEVAGARAAIRHGHVERPNLEDAYLFDIDLFIEERTEPHDVEGILDAFRGLAGDLFRWVITDTLRRALLQPRTP